MYRPFLLNLALAILLSFAVLEAVRLIRVRYAAWKVRRRFRQRMEIFLQYDPEKIQEEVLKRIREEYRTQDETNESSKLH